MSKTTIFILIGLVIVLGTLTFCLKRFLDFDFTAYGTGILLAFIAFVIIKNGRIKKS
jgi:uncharacterized membrane protein YhaH (DUF805 family)